jgi:plastocyanin
MNIRRASSIATAGAMLLLAVPGAVQAEDSTIVIQGFAYAPPAYTTSVGQSVTWVNKDTVAHDAVDGGGAWKTAKLMPNETASVTFETAGTYSYRCSLHPDMRGTVTVVDAVPATDMAPTAAAGGADQSFSGAAAWIAGFVGLWIAVRRFRRPTVSR